MKKIINTPDCFVDEMLDGILAAHPEWLRAASADRRAVVRADAPRAGKVGIVTGGGSGHLPAFLGYVGVGLCDGVAVGNVFSSPSARQIQAATLAVSGGAGVLYLYGNYGGDVYNFDLAADLAAAAGIRTATVLAADDVASAPPERREARRGIAGMVYAFKVAGAAAERGDDLDTVAGVARRAAERTRTMGVGLSPTILPTAGEPTFHLEDGQMEVGIGIHGEPGLYRGALEDADAIADRLLTALLDDLRPERGAAVSVLVDGLGATPLEELYVVYRRVHEVLRQRGVEVRHPLVGNYVTSLEMAGASVSLLLLDDELEELLEAPAASPFFRQGGAVAPVPRAEAVAAVGPAVAATAAHGSSGPTSPLGRVLTAAIGAMPAHQEELRDLDARLGDGDLGVTVASGSRAAVEAIESEGSGTDRQLLESIGTAFASANPSTFAALVGGGLVAGAAALGSAPLTRRSVAAFGRAVLARIIERGGASLGDKTVVDAIAASLDTLEAHPDLDDRAVLDLMIATVGTVVDETSGLVSRRGRAAWLQDRSAGARDPGMVAYHRFLTELRSAL